MKPFANANGSAIVLTQPKLPARPPQAAWEEVVGAAAAAAAEKHSPLLHDPDVLGPLIDKMKVGPAWELRSLWWGGNTCTVQRSVPL